MIKLLRNPEIYKTLLIYTILSIIGIVAAFFMRPAFGFVMLIFCVIFISVYLLSTYKRYKAISELSEDINLILHGDNHISLTKYAEGELGILQSELYKMTVRLREQQQHLIQDKVYLADSIADISHQIRTPLTSINLLVSLLSEENISYEKRLTHTRELYELLSRIDWLITSLLKISKLDAGTVTFNKEETSLSELINEALSPLLIPMELHEQQLIMEADGNFYGDILWTGEAITNIVKNCMEHTPDGGSISISAIENSLFTEIVISDTGSGIATEDLPHIFERFYKGKNSDNKSFGIGLALARMIISSQNGTVKAENLFPNGARFTIRFYKTVI